MCSCWDSLQKFKTISRQINPWIELFFPLFYDGAQIRFPGKRGDMGLHTRKRAFSGLGLDWGVSASASPAYRLASRLMARQAVLWAWHQPQNESSLLVYRLRCGLEISYAWFSCIQQVSLPRACDFSADFFPGM
jgi:hypothetical protein